MNNRTSLWFHPGEDAPAATASAQAIADFIFDDVEGGGFLWGDDEKLFRPITTRQAKQLCEARKYPWLQVAPLLCQRRGCELAVSITDPNLTSSVGGIVINTSLVDVMKDFGWLPMCPKVLTGIHKSTYRNFTVASDCGKWWCPKCGVERLEGLLDQVAERIEGHKALYTASATYESRLPGRMRYRWKTAHAQCFWYRRNDGTVFYVATAPLDGSGSPENGPLDHPLRWWKNSRWPSYSRRTWTTTGAPGGSPRSPPLSRPGMKTPSRSGCSFPLPTPKPNSSSTSCEPP